jgi:hypothetical protein
LTAESIAINHGRTTTRELREKLLTLARQKPRYGYRRLHLLLEPRAEDERNTSVLFMP